jgi:transposase-like protein
MFSEFKNLREMMAAYSDEDKCRAYMEQMRWDGNPTCPFCGMHNPYKLKDGKTYRCKASTCRKDFTVTVGTVFENSKVKLSVWMAALYLCTGHKKGVSSHQLARDLGLTQKTAWFVEHRIRLLMGDPEPDVAMDNVVEVDETYVGGKWDKMTRARRKKHQESGKDNKVAVMGLLERDGKAKLTVIGENTFKDVVRQNVAPSAVVITDAHKGYVGLNEEYQAHEAVNHLAQEFRRGIAYTNSVEGFFSVFKRTIFGTYHQVSPKHLHRYCAETSYRFNTRKMTDAARFQAVISNPQGRLKYQDLIKKG